MGISQFLGLTIKLFTDSHEIAQCIYIGCFSKHFFQDDTDEIQGKEQSGKKLPLFIISR